MSVKNLDIVLSALKEHFRQEGVVNWTIGSRDAFLVKSDELLREIQAWLTTARPSNRDIRQNMMVRWGIDAFGLAQMENIEQRGLRMVEEAIEAAQAAGCEHKMLHKLIDYIYDRPVGNLKQELGGVQVCVAVLANAAGFSADQAELQEIERVLSKPAEHWSARNRVKNAAGFVADAWKTGKPDTD